MPDCGLGSRYVRSLNRHGSDLEELFGLPGGSIVRGCWCMFYRKIGQVSVSKAAGPGHKKELYALVCSGVTPGSVGYTDLAPVGWISLGPRGDYRKLERSRVMKPVDDTPRLVDCVHLRCQRSSRPRLPTQAARGGHRLRP